MLMCAASPGPHNGRGLFSSEAGLPSGAGRPDSPGTAWRRRDHRVSCGHTQISCQGWAGSPSRLPISPRSCPPHLEPRLKASGTLPLQPPRKSAQEGSPPSFPLPLVLLGRPRGAILAGDHPCFPACGCHGVSGRRIPALSWACRELGPAWVYIGKLCPVPPEGKL